MISIIIPALNDEALIRTTISHVRENAYKGLLKEIIVVDGGSSDRTVREASESGAVVISSIRKERAAMMNLGAQYATGKILYFLTPGTLPPHNFTNEIVRATQKGISFGVFQMNFNYRNWILNAVCWFTRQKINFSRLEAQSFFIVNELFVKAGRFREDLMMLEDHEFVKRLKRYSGFVILKESVISPAAKYIKHGVLRTELSYMAAFLLFRFGYPQQRLVKVYQSLLGRNPAPRKAPEVLSPSLT